MACPRLSLLAPLAAALTLSCAAEPPDGPLEADGQAHRGGGTAPTPTLTPQASGVTFRFFAVSPADERVAWASAAGGTYAVTTDGGATWRSGVVPGAEALQFRDVQAVSAREAYLMSAGSGTDSRVYKTVDGGATWTLQAQNTDPAGFWDCFAFWDRDRGVLMADSVNGRLPIMRTRDGETWQDIGDRLPAALPGEFAFAASGTCAATQGHRRAWLVTGGVSPARILATRDGGQRWTAHATPMPPTPSGGNFSVAFRDARHGAVGGGDLDDTAAVQSAFATTRDGGETWAPGGDVPFPGAIFGIAYVSGARHDDDDDDDDGHRGDRRDRSGGPLSRAVVATGPGGAAWSLDEGATWQLLPDVSNCWAVAFASPRAGWLVCGSGGIWKVSF